MNLKHIAVALAIGFSSTLSAAEEVHVYNWSDYIDISLLEKFQQETGIKVVYDVFDSNEILETKLLAGDSGYDVVVPSASFMQRQIEAGVFQKLDKSKLPNSVHLWDLISERTRDFDPDNAYSVNYMWGTTGIGINVDKVREVLGEDAPVNSMALIFDPAYMEKLATCGVNFLDAPAEIINAALTYIGEDPNTQDPEVIKKTEDVLTAIRPYVSKFNSSDYTTALATGEVCVTLGWSGDVLRARDIADEAESGITVEYHAFREGSVMWFDQLTIPADAPNPDAAHKFLNFMMDPENIAAASNFVWYANGNLSSQKFLNAEVLEDTALYPDEETLKTLYTTQPWNPKAQRVVTRLWTRIKSGA